MNTNHEDLCKFMQIHKNEEKFLTSLLCKMHGRDHLQEERQKRHQKRPKVCNKQETALFVLMNCVCEQGGQILDYIHDGTKQR